MVELAPLLFLVSRLDPERPGKIRRLSFQFQGNEVVLVSLPNEQSATEEQKKKKMNNNKKHNKSTIKSLKYEPKLLESQLNGYGVEARLK